MFWIAFVVLKLAELAVVVFVPWRVGRWVAPGDNAIEQWGMGLMVLAAGGGLLFLLAVLGYGLIELNLGWAKSIVGGS